MNALKRFYVLGAEAADRRLAAALAPPPLDAADHYLKDSFFAAALERITFRLQQWWLSSDAKQLAGMIGDRLEREPPARRRQGLASMILIATIVHVGLTLLQGVHPGWFWIIIPAMAAVFAAVLLAASRAGGPAD
jgi:hypothetical protein